ncbi:DEAD/DEAH box helicase [Spirochaetota bacterium]
MDNFLTLGLKKPVAKAFLDMGFKSPSDIQAIAIPYLLKGCDAYISSATGTGKTFAYLAAILSCFQEGSSNPSVMIVVPTHELAAQIERESLKLIKASGLDLKVAKMLGSTALDRQKHLLAQKPDIIIGTPGRLNDLARAKYLNLVTLSWAVLDEADRLFENESLELTAGLLSSLPDGCHRILVSATLPNKTIDRSAPWLRNPVKLISNANEALVKNIEHWCFHSTSRSKLDFIRRFDRAEKPERCILFASSNASIFNIQKKLPWLGFSAAFLKTDRNSTDRKNALEDFAAGKLRWLISTDLAARGLDIPDVSHIISFDLPEEPSVYVHRAGRTGRAGKNGISIALLDLVELKRASKTALRYGFTFTCKILDSGQVYDIDPENFFTLAEENEKKAARSLKKTRCKNMPKNKY